MGGVGEWGELGELGELGSWGSGGSWGVGGVGGVGEKFLLSELLIAKRGVSHTFEWAQALRPYLLIA
ncbi:hypothetical protein AA650_04600 [Anabaena sp. WA102]|nr:hypothetical protein AA650_04600 [Anabaena sp. WA102]